MTWPSRRKREAWQSPTHPIHSSVATTTASTAEHPVAWFVADFLDSWEKLSSVWRKDSRIASKGDRLIFSCRRRLVRRYLHAWFATSDPPKPSNTAKAEIMGKGWGCQRRRRRFSQSLISLIPESEVEGEGEETSRENSSLA